MTRGPTSKELGFAAWLERLVAQSDRGTLAALRRGLMVEEEHLFELYGYLPPNFLASLPPGEERLYLMVAALFGYHPVAYTPKEPDGRRRNIGESLRMLARSKAEEGGGLEPGSGADQALPDSLKRRMEALLSAPREDLFGHLRQVISLLKTGEVAVDWAQLLSDLRRWEWQGHQVQWRWSRSFYVGHKDEGGGETDVP